MRHEKWDRCQENRQSLFSPNGMTGDETRKMGQTPGESSVPIFAKRDDGIG